MRAESIFGWLTCIGSAIALAGCSTVASRRDDPPTMVAQTTKTVAEFRACFLPQFDRQSVPVLYAPTANGETYSLGMSTNLGGRYVMWVLDISDHGAAREVTLHAITSVWGPNRGLMRKVRACL